MEFTYTIILLSTCLLCSEVASNDILSSPLSRQYPQGKSELVFLLDRSGSVGAAYFETEKVFVENLLAHFTVAPDATRVSVITYSEDVVRHIDYIRNPKNKCFFSQEIQRVRYANPGKTNSKAALEEARNTLANARPTVNKVVVMLSDGLSNVGGDPVPTANLLKEDGVEIFTIGVGLFDKQELNSIATSDVHTFEYASFADFGKLASRIRGDPHEVRWDTSISLDTCNNLCSNPTLSFGCCDIDAKCTCALVRGMYDCVCGPGYYGNNGLFGQCTACPRGTYKGTFEPSPSCTPCPDNSNTDSRRSTSIADCHCNEGYEGNPAKDVPCTVKTCPKLRAPPNGKMTPPICDDAFNSQCLFSCDRGYQLVDAQSRMRRCLVTGQWSASEAICEKVTCPDLPGPAHGTKNCNRGNEHGSVCEFTCDRGFDLGGSTHRKCTESGQWSGTDTSCSGKKCPVLQSPVNGMVNPPKCTVKKQGFKKICVFTCNRGYKIVGPPYKTCQASGEWTHADEQVSCVDNSPPDITCPRGIKQSASPGLDSALVQWSQPEVRDNSNVQLTLIVQPADLTSPHRFDIGAHEIKYTVTDGTGLNTSCTFHVLVIDTEPPKVVECPENIDRQSGQKSTIVNWLEPVFTDNSGQVEITQTLSSGVELIWGTHLVQYTAKDPAGNEAVCQFQIKLYPTSCPPHPEPVNGARACDDWLFGMFCRVSCNKKYEFARKPAEWYICDGSGQWRTMPPEFDIPWPDCSQLKIPEKVRKGLKSQYYAGNCNNEKTQKMIKKAFIKEFTESFFGRNGGCQQGPNVCTIEAVTVYCGAINTTIGRQRRDVNGAIYNNLVTITFTIEGEVAAPPEADDDDEEVKLNSIMSTLDEVAGQFEQQTRTGNLVLAVESEILVVDENSFEASATIPVCGNGTVQKDRKCVNCPVGTYYDITSDTCELCSPGYYQDEEAQFECLQCEDGTWTTGNQAKNFTECIDICKAGTYSSTGLATCKSCPKGTYQPAEKQTECFPCPLGTTTSVEGATSLEECRSQCLGGMFSLTGIEPCSPCPIGFYQPERGQRNCIECQHSTTTFGTGIVSADQCTEIDHCASAPCYNDGVCTSDKVTYMCQCSDGYTGDNCESEIDECLSNPCAFNATCLDREKGFQCVCSPGYTGLLCDVEVNECQSSPCWNGGQCQDEVDRFQCVCKNGYSGQFCEIAVDYCAEDPCQNGGMCGQVNESVHCACPSGFTGLYCETNTDECLPNPCLNGASCEDAINSFRCECVEGFEGHLCEVNTNDCQHDRCQNGGTCNDSINGFTCQCPPSYSGQYCEDELSSDYTLEFHRRVTADYTILKRYALPNVNTFTISFWLRTAGQSGTVLSYATSVGNATQDNAIVVSYYGDYKIEVNGEAVYADVAMNDGMWHHFAVTWANPDGKLKFYVDGVLASEHEHVQEGAVIPGGGILILGQEQDELGGGFNPSESLVADLSRLNMWNFGLAENDIIDLASHCNDSFGNLVAWPDFEFSTTAEMNVISPSVFCSELDQCLPNPCQNGGTCYDRVDKFTCECPSGFHGDLCGEKAHHCDPDLCDNGRCRDQGDSYVCDCYHGYSGDHCDIDINECQSQPCHNGGTCIDNVGHYICQCSVQYSGTRCENEITCPLPPTIQHAVVNVHQGAFTVGSEVHLSCRQGYMLSTTTTSMVVLTCNENGEWDGGNVSCDDIDECMTGISNCNQLCINVDGGYRCDCYTGYQLNSDNQTCSDINECSQDTDNRRPSHGRCQHTCHNIAGSFRCSCPDGFNLTSNEQLCQDIDECATSENDCEHSCRNLPGSYICECNQGFILDEDRKSCKAITCPSHPSLPNGMVYSMFSEYLYGSLVMIQCYPGYKLIGPMHRSCEQTGTWSGMTPSCKEIICGLIGTLENGDVTVTGNGKGDTITFTCNEGFQLIGTQVQECTDNGKWSGSRPYCQPII